MTSPAVIESLEQRRLLTGTPLAPSQTWTNLTNSVPNSDFAQVALLLPDGKLMVHGNLGGTGAGDSPNWYMVTPDSTGGYQNGTWTQIASMHVSRLYFGSVVLPNGNVFVVGGEYASDGTYNGKKMLSNSAEMYNPVTNVWTQVASSPLPYVGDEPTELLPNGSILVGDIFDNGTEIYNPTTNTWSAGGAKIHTDDVSDEEAWVKLPNGDILAYDIESSENAGKGEAELYNPNTNSWSDASAGTLPILTDSTYGEELGAALMLPDGRALFNGANGLTAYFNTSTNTWSQGPTMPTVSIGGTLTQLTMGDAPGSILPNGDVLLALSPRVTEPSSGPNFPSPTFIYDLNPTTGVYTDVTPSSSVDGELSGSNSYTSTMLVLPTGQVLLDNFTSDPALYTPNGAPSAAWLPQITGLTNNGNGNYTLTGTQLNGPDEGAAYGDDIQMAENYPIVQVTDNFTGKVYYATTSNWSLVGVATGTTPETVNVAMPAALGNDQFSLVVIADGISSAVDNVFAPTSIQLSNSTVVEHSPIGTIVGSLSSVENGSGNTFTYSLVSGTGSTDNGSFSINANGQLTTNSIFDFNTKNTYSIRVQTTDEHNNTFQQVLTINVVPRQPVTLTVNNFSDTHLAGSTTLREAIAIANSDYVGDTITFASGFIGTIVLSKGELDITAPMTITGPGAGLLTVSGNNQSRIFDVAATNHFNPPTLNPVTITGLTVAQGNGVGEVDTGAGGAIFNSAQLILANDTIKGSTATSSGGGLENTGGVTIYGDTFSGNLATSTGGGIDNSGTLTATNSTIFGNTANIGGGVSNAGTLTTTNDTIAGNTATTSGGGFHNGIGTWNTLNTIVAGNTIPGGGTPTPSDAENVGGTLNALNTLFGDASTSAGITDGSNGNLVGRANSQIFATDINGNPVLANNGGSTLTVTLAKGGVANNSGAALTTLLSPVSAGATSLVVNDPTYIAVGDLLRIDSEIFLVTAVNSNNLAVVGAQDGSTSASHAQNAAITLAFDQTGVARAFLDLGSLHGTENHAPSGGSNLITIFENGSYTFKINDFGFVDPNDIPQNSLLAVEITTLPLNGTLTDNGVAVTAGQFVSATDIGNSQLVYTPAPYGNGTGYGTFTFQVQDNGGTAGGGVDTDPVPKTMSIDVTRINNAPVGTSGTVTALESTAYVFKTSDFGFTDPHDNPPNSLLAVEITTIPAAGTLTDNGIAVTAGQFVPASDILSGNLVFTPAANQLGAAYASFTFQVQDDGGTANGGQDTDPTPKTLTISVAAVNAAPVGTSGTVSTLQGVAYTFKTSDFGFSDPNNNPPNSLLAVKFAILPNAGTLTDNGVPLVAGQFVAATDISGGKLVFTPNASLSGGPYFLSKFQVQDNGGTANGGTDLDPIGAVLDIQITKVNHAPIGTSATLSASENTPYVIKTSDFGFTDPNDNPPNSLLAVTITLLPNAGTIADNGVAVTANQSVSAADISAGKLIFTPKAGLVGGPYFLCKFQVQDNGGTANGGVDLDPNAKILDVVLASTAPANHPPTGTSGIVTTAQNTPYVFNTANFGFSDPNDNPPNTLLAVKFVVLPNAGTITDNGIALTPGQFVNATDISAGKLVFTPKSNLVGGPYFVCLFQVQDNGGTANGGSDLDPSPKVLDVTITH